MGISKLSYGRIETICINRLHQREVGTHLMWFIYFEVHGVERIIELTCILNISAPCIGIGRIMNA